MIVLVQWEYCFLFFVSHSCEYCCHFDWDKIKLSNLMFSSESENQIVESNVFRDLPNLKIKLWKPPTTTWCPLSQLVFFPLIHRRPYLFRFSVISLFIQIFIDTHGQALVEAPSVKYWIVTCATQQHYTIDHTDDDDQNEGNMIFTCCALHLSICPNLGWLNVAQFFALKPVKRAKFSFIIILLFDVNILIGIFLLIEIIIIFLFVYIFNRISSILH